MSKTQKRADLLKTIKGKVPDATCKWDVLVSYDEAKLDDVLKKKWDPKGQPKEVPPFDVQLSTNLVVRYKIKLYPPLLQFTSDKKASLQLPLEGTKQEVYKGEAQKEETITPGNYQLKINAELSSIRGKTGDPVSSDQVIVFDQGTVSEHHIVIPFRQSETTYEVTVTNKAAKDADEIATNTSKGLATHFKNTYAEVDLSLALVTNALDKTSEILRPKSFRFGSQPGVLSIFMRTEGSKREEGDSHPVFDTDNISPIPEKSTASIIISRELFQDGFLIPELKKNCQGLLSNGCSVEVTKDPEVNINLDFDLLMAAGSKLLVDGSTIDVEKQHINLRDEKNPLVLKITNAEPFEAPQYKWVWNWEGKVSYNMITSKGIVIQDLKADATGTLDSSPRALTSIKSDEIDFHLELKNDEQPKLKVPTFEGAITPAAYIGAFTIPLKPLNFFTTKNILVPGAKLVKFSAAMAPAELVLMGDIIDT